MKKRDFLVLMHFPLEWEMFGMYPDELFVGQISMYKAGDENGAEHDRNGAFHWWLKRTPTKDELVSLVKLAILDPDPLMADDVIRHIKLADSFDHEIEDLIRRLRRSK